MAGQCLPGIKATSVSHSAPPVNRLGVHKSLGRGTTRQMTWPNQSDTPCHITSCSAVNQRRAGFEYVRCLLLGRWLGIGLPIGGGEGLPLHPSFWFVQLFFFLSSSASPSVIKLFLSWPMSFLTVSLPFLFPPAHWGTVLFLLLDHGVTC